MNKNRTLRVLVLCVFTALAGCGGSSGGGTQQAPVGGGTSPPPPPPPPPPAPEAVTVELGAETKNVLIQPNVATQVSFTYTMPDDLFSQPYTSYGGFRMKFLETMGNVQLTSSPVADNGQPDGFGPWRFVKSLFDADLFGRLIGSYKGSIYRHEPAT